MRSDKLLGNVLGIYLARAVDEDIVKRRVAGGGAVTALLIYMLERNLVDAVVAVRKVKGLESHAVVARNREEVLEVAGNRWSVAPFTSELKTSIIERGLKRIALVCLPCQAQFLRNMKDFPLLEADFGERIRYIISLFCMGTFASEAFLNYLWMKYGVQAKNIRDIKLLGDTLNISHDEQTLILPLKEAQPYLQEGCLRCNDYTGIWSDISAGIVQSELKWTVLITRNEEAERLLKNAVKEKYVIIREGAHIIREIKDKAEEKYSRAMKYATLV